MTDNRHRAIVLKELEDREVLRAKYRARSRFNNVPQLSSLSASSAPAVHHHSSDQNNTLEKFYSVNLAVAPRHQPLNRYSDITPYDRGCVMVKQNDATGPSQYLNGNWVREVGGNAWCLATQAPLPGTMYTFFSMCTSLVPPRQRIRTIVQLTPVIERGMRKGHPYVPTQVGPKGAFFLTAPSGPHPRTSERDGTHDLPLMEVILVNQREIPDAQCIQSTLRISLRDPFEAVIESVDVQHFFFTAWPDHGVPSDAIPIIKLVHLVDDANSKGGMGSVAPVLVHCSAGVGRTGTFIAISSMFRLFKLLPDVSNDRLGDPTEDQPPAIPPLGRMSQTVSEDLVALEIDGLRELRPGMLQRPEQVLFVYVVLAHALALGKVLDDGEGLSHGA